MAAESSSRSAPGGSGAGAPSADSYIGSLISLITKSEIRYEGVLYNINTEESSIGLRHVWAFGTEGRKKDGPQVAATDKIYEYIVFRGSDVKDLQVKSSPPIPSAQLHHDPAIIQSHYSPRPPSVSTTVPPAAGGTATDLSSQAAQYGLERSSVQENLPLYQPVASLGSWGSSPAPPTADGSALAMPMYWQGYYTPAGALAHMQQVQPPLMRPPPGMPTSHFTPQPLQYAGTNASFSTASSNLTDFPSPLLPSIKNNVNLSSTSLLSTSAATDVSTIAPETYSLLPNKPFLGTLPSLTGGINLPIIPHLTPSLDSVATKSQPSVRSSNIIAAPSVSVPNQTISQSMTSIVGPSSSGQVETSVPLLTPDQLLRPASTSASSQLSQTSNKDIVVKPTEDRMKPLLPESATPAAAAANKEPILPLPAPIDRKPNGTAVHNHYPYRGRGRGRGHGYARPMTRFIEDFDFTAMNEKFNKDEVWGHLGKGKSLSRDKDRDEYNSDDASGEDDAEGPELDIKPTYVKDDFFDTISCNTLDPRNGRTKFSEQLKLDVETFGDNARHRPNRGGGRGYRGSSGGRSRGSYYVRGGYGYGGRGRGNPLPKRSS